MSTRDVSTPISGPGRQAGSRFAHFGEALRYYRETVHERLRKFSPGLPRVQLSAQAVIECMHQSDYPISAGAYSAIELGESLPRDPMHFLEVICPCLAIERDSLDWWILVQYIGRDLVRQKLGNDAADWVIVNEQDLQQKLESRTPRKRRGRPPLAAPAAAPVDESAEA